MKSLFLTMFLTGLLSFTSSACQEKRLLEASSSQINSDSKATKVWYVAYGSNLLKERFLCYIKGGLCSVNNRNHIGCTDKTAPTSEIALTIPYDLYFGSSAGSWENKGVAFLKKTKDETVKTWARGYLITSEQFKQIWDQEGMEPEWYGHLINLGQINGYEAYTFTSEIEHTPNPPSEKYRSVIAKGLKETYPLMAGHEILSYLDMQVAE